MRNRELDAWVWFYRENTKNYPGTHFTAKPEASDEIIRLMAMWEQGYNPKLIIELPELAPEDERKVSGGLTYRCFRTLKLVRHEEPVPFTVLHHREERVVEFHFDQAGQSQFEEVLAEVRAGRGDHSIRCQYRRSADTTLTASSLWYWPCFGHLWPVP